MPVNAFRHFFYLFARKRSFISVTLDVGMHKHGQVSSPTTELNESNWGNIWAAQTHACFVFFRSVSVGTYLAANELTSRVPF